MSDLADEKQQQYDQYTRSDEWYDANGMAFLPSDDRSNVGLSVRVTFE